MRLHANARLSLKGRELLVGRVEADEGVLVRVPSDACASPPAANPTERTEAPGATGAICFRHEAFDPEAADAAWHGSSRRQRSLALTSSSERHTRTRHPAVARLRRPRAQGYRVPRVYATPEAAARGELPEPFVRALAVTRSPDGRYALVLLGCNDPSNAYPCQVLCHRDGAEDG